MDPISHWNSLPAEIKFIIVQHLDNASRLALRSTSKHEKLLVDKVPFRKLHSLNLQKYDDSWCIKVRKEFYSSEEKLEFDSFDEFQTELFEILSKADYVKDMFISAVDAQEVLKLIKPQNMLLKVLGLSINVSHTAQVLCQIDPFALKYLTIQYDEKDPAIYDMPQVVRAEVLGIGEGCIRDEQLMNLNACQIWTTSPRNLTTEGYAKYVKEAIKNPKFERFQCTWSDKKHYKELFRKLYFRCVSGEEKLVMDPSVSDFEIKFDESDNLFTGERNKSTSTENKDSILPKIKKELRIHHDGLDYTLLIDHGDDTDIWHYTESSDVQNKLTEQITNICFIKKLEVQLEDFTCDWKITPKNGKKLTVGHVSIENKNKTNGKLVMDILNQIDPKYLKCVELFGNIGKVAVGEMPQLTNADYVKITHPWVLDEQLINFRATNLILGFFSHNQSTGSKLTVYGVNEYIKKCLAHLNEQVYEFELVLYFEKKSGELLPFLFKDLDIASYEIYEQKTPNNHRGTYIVNSELSSQYQLKLEVDGRLVKGKRVSK